MMEASQLSLGICMPRCKFWDLLWRTSHKAVLRIKGGVWPGVHFPTQTGRVPSLSPDSLFTMTLPLGPGYVKFENNKLDA